MARGKRSPGGRELGNQFPLHHKLGCKEMLASRPQTQPLGFAGTSGSRKHACGEQAKEAEEHASWSHGRRHGRSGVWGFQRPTLVKRQGGGAPSGVFGSSTRVQQLNQLLNESQRRLRRLEVHLVVQLHHLAAGAFVHDGPTARAAVDGQQAELAGRQVARAARGEPDVAAQVGVEALHRGIVWGP